MTAIIDRAPSRDGPIMPPAASVQSQLWMLVNASPEERTGLIDSLAPVLPEDATALYLWLTPGQLRLVATWLPAPWRLAAVTALKQSGYLHKSEFTMIEVLGLDQKEFIPPPDAPPES